MLSSEIKIVAVSAGKEVAFSRGNISSPHSGKKPTFNQVQQKNHNNNNNKIINNNNNNHNNNSNNNFGRRKSGSHNHPNRKKFYNNNSSNNNNNNNHNNNNNNNSNKNYNLCHKQSRHTTSYNKENHNNNSNKTIATQSGKQQQQQQQIQTNFQDQQQNQAEPKAKIPPNRTSVVMSKNPSNAAIEQTSQLQRPQQNPPQKQPPTQSQPPQQQENQERQQPEPKSQQKLQPPTKVQDHKSEQTDKRQKSPQPPQKSIETVVIPSTSPPGSQLPLPATPTAVPLPPASYSLDFLHSVGVQMTAGANRSFVSVTGTPSGAAVAASATLASPVGPASPLPENHGKYHSTNGMKAGHYNMENEMHYSGGHDRASPNEIAYSSHSPVASCSRNSPLQSHHTIVYHSAGYQGHSYFPHSHHTHFHFHHPQHQFHSPSGGALGTVPHFNNRGYQGNRKNWNWNHAQHNNNNNINNNNSGNGNASSNSKMNKSNGNANNNNNNNNNKYNSTSNNSLNNSASQSTPRMRNHQNHHNLTYVHTDGGRIIGNSRSPTPSPKSESPSLLRAQQHLNGISHYAAADDGRALTASSTPSVDTIYSTNQPINGYDSDSSQNSSKQNEYVYRPRMSSAANFQFGEMLTNFPTFSEEDILRGHGGYYGSHQSLNFWNSNMGSSAYSPHNQSMYSNSGSVSSENGSQYLGDASTSTKRRHSNQRSYRGRRHIYPNPRAHSFHETQTPPDKFLARAHLIEMKTPPDNLLCGSKWDELSENIWERFVGSQQTEHTYRNKMNLWRYLYISIKKAYPRFGLYLVGSTISGFGADTSDVDMCLVSRNISNLDPRLEAVFNLTNLKNYLNNTGAFKEFNLIQAKVPILRFRDTTYLLEVDLNFNNCVGIRNTHLLHCYAQLDWRLRPLALVVKLWAQFHNINNAKTMTISSYSLVLMVIHFLQFGCNPPVLPCLHEMYPEKFQVLLKTNDFGFVDMNEVIEPFYSQNTQPLGELFLQFLEYYCKFNYSQHAISIRTGAILPIEICRHAISIKNDPGQWKQLCIEEPFDLTNTARSVYDGETFERIKAVFYTSWKVLQETMDLNAIFTPFEIIPTYLMAPTISSSTNSNSAPTTSNILTNMTATLAADDHQVSSSSSNIDNFIPSSTS